VPSPAATPSEAQQAQLRKLRRDSFEVIFSSLPIF
jgi:hypothetical protein